MWTRRRLLQDKLILARVRINTGEEFVARKILKLRETLVIKFRLVTDFSNFGAVKLGIYVVGAFRLRGATTTHSRIDEDVAEILTRGHRLFTRGLL